MPNSISKSENLEQLISLISKKEISSFDKTDIYKMKFIIGHTSQEEFHELINGDDEIKKFILIYILSNIWTFQAVHNFWNNHLDK